MQTCSVFIIPILFVLVKAFKKSFLTQIFHALCADFDDLDELFLIQSLNSSKQKGQDIYLDLHYYSTIN